MYQNIYTTACVNRSLLSKRKKKRIDTHEANCIKKNNWQRVDIWLFSRDMQLNFICSSFKFASIQITICTKIIIHVTLTTK